MRSHLSISNKVLEVRGIVVVDTFGIERVMIGSHLPEPNFATGNRVAARGKTGSVSGGMFIAAKGVESGRDIVQVTLSKQGESLLTQMQNKIYASTKSQLLQPSMAIRAASANSNCRPIKRR